MAGVTHIDIKESVEELEAYIRQQKNARIKQRVQALYLIKVQNMDICAIARRADAFRRIAKTLGKHRSTVQRCKQITVARGLMQLLSLRQAQVGQK